MLMMFVETSFLPPWQLYGRFWLMPLIAALALPLFGMLYHLPEWDASKRRELQFVFVLVSIRLLYELYWAIVRSLALANSGFLIARRPLILDIFMVASLFWIVVMIVRRIRRFQQRFGLLIFEALLLGLLVILPALAQMAYTSSLLTYASFVLMRDGAALFMMPFIVLVLLELLSDALALMVRLLVLSLLMVMAAISMSSLVIAPLLRDPQIMHLVMLRLLLLGLVSVLVVSIGVPFVLKRSIFRPLRAILKAAHQVNSGDLSVRVPVVFADEIGQMTESFNRMVAELHSMVQELELRVQERTAALEHSESRYRELVEHIDEVIFRISLPDLKLEYISPSVERMLGYPISHMLAAPFFMHEIVHPDDRAITEQYIAALSQNILSPFYEYRVFDVHGQERWLQQSNTGIYVEDKLIALEGICRDITDTRKAGQLLLAQQRELAALHERERIGRDLHDGLGQVMGYVNLQTQNATALIAADQISEAQAILSKLTLTAQEAHANIRSYILDLRLLESAPIQQSWKTSLQVLLKSFEQRYNFTTTLEYPATIADDPFDLNSAKEVLQIILEALNNIHKHAATDQAQLRLERESNALLVIVEDQGAGFNSQSQLRSLDSKKALSGLGLQMMHERANLIHADLRIQSTPGTGTRLLLRIPDHVQALRDGARVQEENLLSGLRVLLVDDHALFIEGLRTMLKTRGLQVVGVAQDGFEAQQLAQQLQPDIILMDMHMPNCNGTQATAAIKAVLPATKIIMLTVAAEEAHLFEALKAGASGYLLKSLERESFFQLLQDAMHGALVLSPELATQTLEAFPQQHMSQSPTSEPSLSPAIQNDRLLILSVRQRDILERVAAGQTYKEVAAALFITEPTIKYHMSQIIELLQVKGRREAIALTRHMGSSNNASTQG